MKILLSLILSFGCLLPTLMAQAENRPDPSTDILPPSPTAAAFAKYVDFPVNYSTGTPQISVPLGELSSKGITVPVYLSYHAGGVRVDDMASNVGLGWSLMAGGTISRTVRGLADEKTNGFIEKGGDIPSSPITDVDDLKPFAKDLASGGWDGQPDLFNFNFAGYSGKFILNDTANIQTIPIQDLIIKIEEDTSNDIIKITIKTPDGLVYTFGTAAATETSKTSSYQVDGSLECNVRTYDQKVVTAWHLKTIYDPLSDEEVTFNYGDYVSSYDLSYNETFRHPAASPMLTGCSESQSAFKCVTIKNDEGKYLSSIVSSNGRVDFLSNNTRQDMIINSGANRIEAIEFKSTGGSLLKKYAFNQSFIESSGATASTSAHADYRMYLDEVVEYDSQNNLIASHLLEYHSRTSLPPRLSYKQDHWGYYNSNGVNQITPYPVGYYITLSALQDWFTNFSPANRTPDGTKSKYGTLKRITYPTGGYVDYDYENNTVAVCDDVTTIKDAMPITVEAVYDHVNNMAVTETETLTLTFPQWITVDYKVLMNAMGDNGAWVAIKNSSGGTEYQQGGIKEMLPIYLDGTEDIYLPAGTYTVEAVTQQDAMPIYGTAHEEPEKAIITVFYQEKVTEYIYNKDIGGIRLKSLIASDGDTDDSNNIVRLFKYHQDQALCTDASSGIQLGKDPFYATTEQTAVPQTAQCVYTRCPYYKLSSSSLINLTNNAGSIVEYEEVWEWQGTNAENGEKYFKFIVLQDLEPTPPLSGIFINTAYTDLNYKSGKLIEERTFNASGDIVTANFFDYEFTSTVREEATLAIMAKERYALPCPENANLGDFAYQWYEVKTQWIYLNSKTERQYHPGGSYTEILTEYTYDATGRHTMPIEISVTNSDNSQQITRSKYPPEYDVSAPNDAPSLAIAALVKNNMISQPIEVTQLIAPGGGSEAVIGGQVTHFEDFGDAMILPVETYKLALTSPIGSFTASAIDGNGDFTKHSGYYSYQQLESYDTQGNLTEYRRTDDQLSSLVWGHGGVLPIAGVKNAEADEVAFTSFEEQAATTEANGGWLISGTTGWETAAGSYKTGTTGLKLGNSGAVSRSGSPSGTYVVAFWYKGEISVDVPNTDLEASDWTYYEETFPLSGTLTIDGTSSDAYIDELRLFPIDAQMVTYSYDDDKRQLLSITDENGVPIHYEYDDLQRLKGIQDYNGDFLQTVEYEYQDHNNSSTINTVKKREILEEGITSFSTAVGLTGDDVKRVFEFFDGLGRPVQTLGIDQSPTQKDIVSHQEYDEFGRMTKVYLPFTVASSGEDYFTTVSTELDNFFGSGAAAYTTQQFEDAPTNRVEVESAPGTDWQIGTDHTTEYVYRGNNSGEVRIFGNGTSGGTYAANTLLVTEINDENDNVSKTYTDKWGRQILTDQAGKKTYYVYNGFSELVAVIPPQVVADMESSGNYNYSTTYADRIFSYTYDERRRMSSKHVPGGGAMEMEYDRLDRPVLTEDANGTKIFTKYDILSRPVMTGKYTGSNVPLISDGLYESRITVGPHYYTTSGSYPNNNLVIYTVSYYDDYDVDQDNSLDSDENYQAPPTGFETPTTWVRAKPTVNKTAILPSDGTDPTEYLVDRTYYDLKNRVVQTKTDNHLDGQDVVFNEYYFPGWVKRTRREHTSNPTGSAVVTQNITQQYEYDHSGRLLNTYHQLNGEDGVLITQQAYDERDFLAQKKLHQDGANFLQTVDYSYNIRGWLESINSFDNASDLFALQLTYGAGDAAFDSRYSSGANASWNGNITMMEWQVAEKDHQTYGFFYDANDRLIEAEYGERATSGGSYSLNHRYQTEYSYFDNGDLHTLSRKGRVADGTYVTIDDLTYNYYADQTRLQDVEDDASATDNIRDYGFAYYDITATGADYTYDANGNIIYDPAKGLTISYNHLNLPVEVTKAGGGSIEWLYDANGNKLRKTSQPDVLSLSGTIPTGVYQADQITSDGTVPTGAAVLFRAGTEIELQAGFETQINSDFEATIAINGSGVQDYVGGMEYRDGALEAIYHECGRLFFGGTSTPRYEYTIADHLGNTRVTFADLNGDGQVDAAEVLQENQYYPFGMQMEGDWLQHSEERNAYQFNGKELNQDLGLNWLDYGARWFDPSIGRWNAVDPLAEEMSSWSPYNYTFNNPVRFIDPNGMAPLHDYGLDVNTGEVTLIRKTNDDTHTIYTGTTDRRTGEFSKGVDGYVKSITIAKESSNIEEVVDEFGDASAGGIVFSGGEEAHADGRNVLEFISFESHTELAGWGFDSDGDSNADGIYINRWDENTPSESLDEVDLYDSTVTDAANTGDYLGEKVYKIHTHPGTRGGEGGFANPSRTDMTTTRERTRYPHYILSRLEGLKQYSPKEIRR